MSVQCSDGEQGRTSRPERNSTEIHVCFYMSYLERKRLTGVVVSGG